MIKKLSIIFMLMLSTFTSVLSQTNSVYVDIGPCMAITDNTRRYACYDLIEQQVRAAERTKIEYPVVSLPRNIPENQPETDIASENQDHIDQNNIEDFGQETPATSRNREVNAKILSNDDGDQELVDTISDLNERLPGQWQITLASGQVWHQINSKNYRLREGMEVRIYPSPFGGSFRLSAINLNGFIQVQRVQ